MTRLMEEDVWACEREKGSQHLVRRILDFQSQLTLGLEISVDISHQMEVLESGGDLGSVEASVLLG